MKGAGMKGACMKEGKKYGPTSSRPLTSPTDAGGGEQQPQQVHHEQHHTDDVMKACVTSSRFPKEGITSGSKPRYCYQM